MINQKLIFARAYEKNNMLDKALQIFSSLSEFDNEVSQAIKRIKDQL